MSSAEILGEAQQDILPIIECTSENHQKNTHPSGNKSPEHHAKEAECIFVGKYFNTKQELLKRIRLHAMKHNFEFRSRMSDKKRVVLGCVDRTCDWRFTAYRVDVALEGFVIQHYVSEHTCDTTHRNVGHRQATAKILGEMISTHFGVGKLGLKPKQIIEKIRNDHGINITYAKAYKAQYYAETMARGSPDDNYKILPKWFHVIKEKNPGSVPYIKTDTNNRFKYAFLSLGPSIRGFKLLRKIIAIDGAFLKSKFKGTLLGATAQDGNFQLFPIAFGIVDSENDEAWYWFLNALKSVVPDEKDLVFVSDRAQSIANGLSRVYPLAHHSICTFHFERNIATRFKSTPVMALVQEAARAYTQREFNALFIQIKQANASLADYIESAGFSKWSRAYSPVNRYNIMTTNIAESLNAMLSQPREYPIVFLLETIRATLTRWFNERYQRAINHKHPLTKEVGKIMKDVYESSRSMEVSKVNEDMFEVKGEHKQHIVNLRTKMCTCCRFQIDGYPCTHAFAAVKRSTLSENNLVSKYFTNERLIQLYDATIYPAGHEDDWEVPQEVSDFICLPPSTRIPSGRRKKNRIQSTWEHGSKRKFYKCGRCGKAGHNKSKCLAQI